MFRELVFVIFIMLIVFIEFLKSVSRVDSVWDTATDWCGVCMLDTYPFASRHHHSIHTYIGMYAVASPTAVL